MKRKREKIIALVVLVAMTAVPCPGAQHLLSPRIMADTDAIRAAVETATQSGRQDGPIAFQVVKTEARLVHDLNNVVTILLGNIELSAETLLNSFPQQEQSKIKRSYRALQDAAEKTNERAVKLRKFNNHYNLLQNLLQAQQGLQGRLHTADRQGLSESNKAQIVKQTQLLFSSLPDLKRTINIENNEYALVEKLLQSIKFEGSKANSQITGFGQSKERRNDRPLITLALVVDDDGFPKQSRIFPGNPKETASLEESCFSS